MTVISEIQSMRMHSHTLIPADDMKNGIPVAESLSHSDFNIFPILLASVLDDVPGFDMQSSLISQAHMPHLGTLQLC